MPLPTAILDPSCVWNPDILQSVVESLQKLPRARTEAGGALYKDANGNYCYSLPVSQGKEQDLGYGVKLPPGATLAGIYHTHPQPHGGDKISEKDMDTASQLKVPSFVYTPASGNVRQITPGAKDMPKIIAKLLSTPPT